MFLSNETTPMSVSQTSPLVVEFFSSVNGFFCPNEFGTVDSGRVSDSALFFSFQKKLNEVKSCSSLISLPSSTERLVCQRIRHDQKAQL